MSEATFNDEYFDLQTGDQLISVRRRPTDQMIAIRVGEANRGAAMTPADAEQLALTLLVMAREARSSGHDR